jgi:hypothetical protein
LEITQQPDLVIDMLEIPFKRLLAKVEASLIFLNIECYGFYFGQKDHCQIQPWLEPFLEKAEKLREFVYDSAVETWDWTSTETKYPNIKTFVFGGNDENGLKSALRRLPNLENLYLGTDTDLSNDVLKGVKKSHAAKLKFLHVTNRFRCWPTSSAFLFSRILHNVESLCLEFQTLSDEFLFLFVNKDNKSNCRVPNLRNLALLVDDKKASRFLDLCGSNLPPKLENLRLGCWPSPLLEVSKQHDDGEMNIIERLRKLPESVKYIQFKEIVLRKGEYAKQQQIVSRPFMADLERNWRNASFRDGLTDFFFQISD